MNFNNYNSFYQINYFYFINFQRDIIQNDIGRFTYYYQNHFYNQAKRPDSVIIMRESTLDRKLFYKKLFGLQFKLQDIKNDMLDPNFLFLIIKLDEYCVLYFTIIKNRSLTGNTMYFNDEKLIEDISNKYCSFDWNQFTVVLHAQQFQLIIQNIDKKIIMLSLNNDHCKELNQEDMPPLFSKDPEQPKQIIRENIMTHDNHNQQTLSQPVIETASASSLKYKYSLLIRSIRQEPNKQKKYKATNIPKFLLKVFSKSIPFNLALAHKIRLKIFFKNLSYSKTRFDLVEIFGQSNDEQKNKQNVINRRILKRQLMKNCQNIILNRHIRNKQLYIQYCKNIIFRLDHPSIIDRLEV